MNQILLLFVLMHAAAMGYTQTACTTLGQNPATAFPVCGTNTFAQSSVPLCGGRPIPTSCPSSGGVLTDINPFWYKFTCFQSGTLEFLITPHDLSEDYDWQIFDVTGKNPAEVYTNINLLVTSNWSGDLGLTGASKAGTQLNVCGGGGKPLFSKPADLVAGHDYLMLISHFTNTQSGYDLSFGGGTAVITDPKDPHLTRADANCSGTIVRVKLNKNMKCASLTASGSEFTLQPANASVTGARGIRCNVGFETDSLELTLDRPLIPGNYTLNIKQGTDGNTIRDLCDKQIPVTDIAAFAVSPNLPTPMDSLISPTCSPQQLKLVFRRPLLCTSIAANGSDFTINGPYPVTITGVTGCSGSNTTTREVTIQLSAPLQQGGNFSIVLKRGTDGNTLLDECSMETPAGSAISFSVKDIVHAAFTYTKFYGCTRDTIRLFHPGNNGVNTWQWNLADGQTSNLQNPQGYYTVFEPKLITLRVSNGFCSDSSAQTIILDNAIKAAFTSFDDNCPNEPVLFTSQAEGKITDHFWQFGDGGTEDEESPSHVYAGPLRETAYTVRYTVTDSIGCQSTVSKVIRIYTSCLLAVPSAFTPNGDGKNDRFYPANAIKAEQLEFVVFNRWGQLLYKTNIWNKGWDGTYKGKPQDSGVYVWLLRFTERDTKKVREMKGTITLIR
jgi:gliding motility-associated-like protein